LVFLFGLVISGQRFGLKSEKKGGDDPHRATIAIHREFTARVYVNISNK
jgi:hypothetical protein